MRIQSTEARRFFIAVALLLTACGDDGEAAGPVDEEQPVAVVTHSLLGDVVRNVVGDQADVEVVMPPGTDPHEFEPSAAQVALVYSADLVVANGLGFEAGLLDAIDSAAGDGITILSLGEHLDPLPLDESDHGEEYQEAVRKDEQADELEGNEHEPGAEDPHWFTDPLRMIDAVHLVAAAVSDIDDVDVHVVDANADAYAADLENADAEIATELSAIPPADRQLVTNHEVFGYFAERYRFEVVGTVIPSGTTLAEPSSADVAALEGVIRETQVPAIFADTSSPSALADMLATDTGNDIQVVELFSESLGGPGSGGATYLEMIHTNADRIVDALT